MCSYTITKQVFHCTNVSKSDSDRNIVKYSTILNMTLIISENNTDSHQTEMYRMQFNPKKSRQQARLLVGFVFFVNYTFKCNTLEVM